MRSTAGVDMAVSDAAGAGGRAVRNLPRGHAEATGGGDEGRQTLKRMFSTSPSRIGYVLPSSRCWPRRGGPGGGAPPPPAAAAHPHPPDEHVPADHLTADEAARDVGVDRLGRIERRLPLAERPRPRLLLARGEER